MPACLGTSASVRASSMPEVGDLRARRPHLLAVHDPLVAVGDGLGLEPGQVGAGPGLAEELAPRLAAGDDVGQQRGALLVGAVGDDGRTGQEQAEAARRTDRAEAGDLLADVVGLVAADALAVPLDRPRRRRPSGHAEPFPPLGHRQVRIPVLLEPAAQLVDDRVVPRVAHRDNLLPCASARHRSVAQEQQHPVGSAVRRHQHGVELLDERHHGLGACGRPRGRASAAGTARARRPPRRASPGCPA